jgi:hypothetical protein
MFNVQISAESLEGLQNATEFQPEGNLIHMRSLVIKESGKLRLRT